MLAGTIARARSLWRGLRPGARVAAEMTEEFRLHLELRAEDLVRAGASPAEAARRAREEFGSRERYQHEGRAARGLRPFDLLGVSWLDVKLGFRMLVKYPGLTLVGGLAIAFAIATGAGTFEIVRQVLHPSLPLPEGDRIVGLDVWDAAARGPEPRVTYDLTTWRAELRSVVDLGAYRTVERNLIGREGRGEPVSVAEISPSAFWLVRVAPLLGRPLVDADERPGSAPVVVIGHDLWQSRFHGDPAIVGREVRLGAVAHTVVGVMPPGFAFPVQHALWVPLHLAAADVAPRRGPAIQVFGRLAPGASLDAARAELTLLGRRAAASSPTTHAQLRPRVMPYARAVVPLPEIGSIGLLSIDVFLAMLLVLVSGNVALLMFARAVTREGEIVVRNALGASRGRIVVQLFAEALVLTGLATLLGLAVARFGLRSLLGVLAAEAGGALPFWFAGRLSPATLLYAAALAALGAVIAGVVPALRVTGRGVQTRLRQAAAGGAGPRFGGLWTAVIVSQVAVTVAFPATAFFAGRYVSRMRALDPGFAAAEFLAVRLEMDADTSAAAHAARFGTTARELERRVAAEPGVLGVTFADHLPRTHHTAASIELEAPSGYMPNARADSAAGEAPPVGTAVVDPSYFDVLGRPITIGRGFHSGDLAPDARVVIVNRSFVRQVLGGRNALGRRIRYRQPARAAEPGAPPPPPAPWYEIVGVAPDLGLITDDADRGAGIYLPAEPGVVTPSYLIVHLRRDPPAFAPRLRTLATAVDPTLRLHDVTRLDAAGATMWMELAFLFRVLVVVSAVALLLALAGIYAVMAFTVSRRTREIGVRVALGAPRARVVAAIFARPLTQVAGGLVAGMGLVALLTQLVSGLSWQGGGLVVAYVVLMLGVCLLACIVPTRRALRVQPTEALRSDG